ncbi:DegT/DnrJ/EryC1/StrS family aminotransferase, partial [Saccharothrix sp. MB29]|nr:DegT/DnrJ/EryC1/StrS family aminotransferase [Saccharothrix sp. MB29]
HEISAAMGLTSLDAMDEFIEVNERNHACYLENLAAVPGVQLRSQPAGERANHQYVVVEVDERVSGVHRDQLHAVLHANNVLARRYFHPACHQVEPFRSRAELHAPLPLPRTEALVDRVLALPTGTSVGVEQVRGICELIADAVRDALGDVAP